MISATETKIVTRRIPERKNTLYTNFEKKLDKTNDLTKQKIKARTELKGIFKDYSLSLKSGKAGDLSALKDEIKRIENKFPNLITEELVGKIAKQFSIDLEDKIKNSNNINPENNTEAEKFDSRREDILKMISDFDADRNTVFKMHER